MSNLYDDERDVYSGKVHAGRRTYFFDIKSTRNGDHYMVITESRKLADGGDIHYEKCKIRLYGEDLGKFRDGFEAAAAHVKIAE